MKTKVMKTLVGAIAALLLIGMVPMEAKSQLFSVGDKDLNLGIGLGTYYGARMAIPPISLSLDYAFKDDIGPGVIGIGGYFGFGVSKDRWYTLDYGWRFMDIMAGARGTYHVEFIDKLDTYAGIIVGLRFRSSGPYGTWPIEPDSYTDIFPNGGFFIGGKYYVQDNLALFCELGYSIAYLTFGATFKL